MAFRSVKDFFRFILEFTLLLGGMFFLSKSTFSKLQIPDDETKKVTVFSFLSALFTVFLFVGPDLKKFVVERAKGRVKHFVLRSMVVSFTLVVFFVLNFLIKYPRFNIHSEYDRPCVNKQSEEISGGTEWTFFSFLAFDVLVLLIAFKRKNPSQLGFFSILLGLTIDTALEAQGTNGPSLFYVCFALLSGVSLIFLRCYAESWRERADNNAAGDAVGEANRQEAQEERLSARNFQIVTWLQLLFTSAGMISVSFSSFTKQQFAGSENLRVACFGVFTLLIGTFMSKLPEWIDEVAVKYCKSIAIKAVVSSLLQLIMFVLIFLNKYPRFKVHSVYLKSCTEKEKRKITHGRFYDLLSVGTFSALALVVSSGEEQPMEFGIFSFLLQLTVEVAIENLENEGPNVWYIIGTVVYVTAFTCLKIWLSARRSGNGVEEDAAAVNFVSTPLCFRFCSSTFKIRSSFSAEASADDASQENEDDVLSEEGTESSGETEWEMVGGNGISQVRIGDSDLDGGQRITSVATSTGTTTTLRRRRGQRKAQIDENLSKMPWNIENVRGSASSFDADNVLLGSGNNDGRAADASDENEDDVLLGSGNIDDKAADASHENKDDVLLGRINEGDIGDSSLDSGHGKTDVFKPIGKSATLTESPRSDDNDDDDDDDREEKANLSKSMGNTATLARSSVTEALRGSGKNDGRADDASQENEGNVLSEEGTDSFAKEVCEVAREFGILPEDVDLTMLLMHKFAKKSRIHDDTIPSASRFDAHNTGDSVPQSSQKLSAELEEHDTNSPTAQHEEAHSEKPKEKINNGPKRSRKAPA